MLYSVAASLVFLSHFALAAMQGPTAFIVVEYINSQQPTAFGANGRRKREKQNKNRENIDCKTKQSERDVLLSLAFGFAQYFFFVSLSLALRHIAVYSLALWIHLLAFFCVSPLLLLLAFGSNLFYIQALPISTTALYNVLFIYCVRPEGICFDSKLLYVHYTAPSQYFVREYRASKRNGWMAGRTNGRQTHHTQKCEN